MDNYIKMFDFAELESALTDLKESLVIIDDLEFVMVDSLTG